MPTKFVHLNETFNLNQLLRGHCLSCNFFTPPLAERADRRPAANLIFLDLLQPAAQLSFHFALSLKSVDESARCVLGHAPISLLHIRFRIGQFGRCLLPDFFSSPRAKRRTCQVKRRAWWNCWKSYSIVHFSIDKCHKTVSVCVCLNIFVRGKNVACGKNFFLKNALRHKWPNCIIFDRFNLTFLFPKTDSIWIGCWQFRKFDDNRTKTQNKSLQSSPTKLGCHILI